MRYKLLLFAHDGGIDGTGGFLAGAHGQDDGGSAGNGVAAGVDALGRLVRPSGPLVIRQPCLLASRPGVVERISGLGLVPRAMIMVSTSSDKLAALFHDGTAAAGSIRLAQLHLHAVHAA